MAEKTLAEDEANMLLRRRVAEVEEANTRLEETNAELRFELTSSGDAVTMSRRELDEEIEHCRRLRRSNARLLNERNN
jgi:hypothetical protein